MARDPRDRMPPVDTGIIAYMVRHRTAANLLLVLMLVAGLAAGLSIRTQFFPDVVLETVTVRVAWPGAGPDDMDRAVVALLEPGLRAIEGVESSSSVSTEGSATITLDFEPGWDMARATDDVKAVVDSTANLPENSKEPVIRRWAYRDRVTDVVIYGPTGIEQLSRYADELQARLFREGATRTTIRGVADPVIRVSAPEAMLIRHELTLREIADEVAAESTADPAGDVASGGSRIRAGLERRDAELIGDIAVRSLPDGGKLYLRDVARIELERFASGRAYYQRGDPAVVVRVERSAQGDAIAIQGLVQRVVDEMRPTLPPDVTVQLTRTRAQAIKDRLRILLDNGLAGLGLVLVFLFLFLSARTAFWVAVGIPTAMAATVAMIYLAGFTLNMVSLFALIICLGIVVDDAIVVGEHTDFLARRGMSPTEAAVAAARRMWAPVFSASITTVIAFSALAVVGGHFGTMIIDIPFTVSVVLLASLAEAFLILPAHMRHSLAAGEARPWYDAPSRLFNKGFTWFRDGPFRRFTRLVVKLRYPMIGAAIMLLLLSASFYVDGTVGWRFFNAPERGYINANIAMLPGADRQDTRAMLDEMQRALDVVNDRYAALHGAAPVKFSLASIGGSTGRGLHGAQSKDPDLLGGFSIELIDPDMRPYSAFAFMADWQSEIVRHPLLETLALRGQRSGPARDSIDVTLSGQSGETLKAAAEDLKTRLGAFSAVSALEDSLAYDKSEQVLTLTPRGESLGFNTEQIAAELYNRLQGIDAVEFPVGARTATIRISLPEEDITAAFLHETRLRTPAGGYVPVSEIVRIEERQSFASVRRENGQRIIRVSGDISEDDPEAATAVAWALESDILPEIAARFGVEWQMRGLAEQEREFLADAALGYVLCLIGIYLTLAWIFSSWTRPLVIMAIIPFGLIGMIWGHYWHGLPLSMFSIVGLIGMSGIIINDSIVLITTIDRYADRRALVPALIDGVADRLRPVILTTATTVFGLAPLLFETSRQAQFLMPTVITLVYGLGFGVLIVLVVTPALVAVQHDVGFALRSGRRLLTHLSGARRRASASTPRGGQ
ncbi:MAG: efflux RND transporter permease subunit [Rhodospirillales bacterium]|nr:MAG: efflux RND transporter permease subunit [Rhodospirillales bacterium]